MPLSEDQKALLRLLAQRDEGYEDIGALLGIDVEEVRSRVRAALAELNTVAADPSPKPPAAARPLQAPQWPPRLPESRARRRLLALAAALVGVVAAVLIGVMLLGGGSDTDSSRSAATGSDSPAMDTSAVDNSKLTQATLAPVGGGEARGRAILGKLEDEVVLEVLAKGLAPSAPGESYAIWLYHDPKTVLRIGAARVGESGGLAVRLPIPTELLAYIAGGAFGQIYISATPEAAYKAEVAKAKAESRLPAYTGTTVLRGTIVGPALRQAR